MKTVRIILRIVGIMLMVLGIIALFALRIVAALLGGSRSAGPQFVQPMTHNPENRFDMGPPQNRFEFGIDRTR